MKPFEFRSALVIAVMTILSACGGTATEGASTPLAAEAATISANAPVADCEAEGCNRPRIIDGLAEQYRASAVLKPAPAVEPVQAGMLPAQASASEAAPAVLAPPQAPALN
jgi:hypothetical protein